MSSNDSSSVVPEIAIIGMSGRFPGADSLEEFWQNLRNGVESVCTFTNSSIDPNRPITGGRLAGAELFDAAFFGFNPREAEITDPQHRLTLECAWAALESAGYNPYTYGSLIGVFVGCSPGWYGIRLFSNPEVARALGQMQVMVGTDSHFLATRVSYKLNLRGPSLLIQTACSTSLVAVHLACQSLLNGECDMALAGGVGLPLIACSVADWQSISTADGGIVSADGHCRAFDADAQGTVGGDGVGIVVLKRLEEALRDGDCIQAVIKGSAINNDGSLKVGYTAPSIEGQAKVIAEAIAISGVEPESITYVEAHGTGTPMGDPIEVAALTRAFGSHGGKRQFCGIGSVKTNIGHLDGAAGIASLIKTILALKHSQLPPSLHFKSPNPNIDFENSPFYVNHELREWKSNGWPRRAGVSAFGFGGTNAHMMLEEAPAKKPLESLRIGKLWLLSARTPAALEQATNNLRNYLDANRETDLADAAYTLQVGRRHFAHRRAFVAGDRDATLAALGSFASQPRSGAESPRKAQFLFPGQGAQYVNMGRELYQTEPGFREQIDRCCTLLTPDLGFDLRALLYPDPAATAEAEQKLNQTSNTQPALFVVEYALAQLWLEWGVQPGGMLGHSIGEYVAATLAGVFSLEEALHLVAARGRLMQALPPGAMLAVPLGERQIAERLTSEVSVAAISGPSACVVSGTFSGIQQLKHELSQGGIESLLLETSHAFHSHMMEPALEAFAAIFRKIRLSPPAIPYVSNVTGDWITAEEATDSQYWVRHLREPVRIGDGIAVLAKDAGSVLLEVGPGRTLSSLVRHNVTNPAERIAVSSLRHPREQSSDQQFILNSLGKMWVAGVSIDWQGFHRREKRYRVSLPTYPFERQRYWIDFVRTETTDRIPGASSAVPDKSEVAAGRASALPLQARADSDVPFVAPCTQAEKTISEFWSVALGISGIGIKDNFFDLGGNSLVAIQLIARLRTAFGFDVVPEVFFDNPTIESFAAAIAAKIPAEGSAQGEGTQPSEGATIPPLVPQSRPALLPLSYAQQRLWFIDQLQDSSTEYNVPNAFHLWGDVDVPALERALSTIVERHEVLRTHFIQIEGDPVQVIETARPVDLAVEDFSALDEASRREQMTAAIQREWNEPFDLASGPLFRVRLLKLSPQHHALLRTFHHIVSDGWSEGVFNYELLTLYAAFHEGRENPLEPLAVQYADFTLWQRKWLNEQAQNRELAYWQGLLQGAPEQLELPKDRSRGAVQTFAADLCHASLSPGLTASVKQLAQASQATLYMTLLSAFFVLLQRYSGQDDVVVGSPIANRHEPQLEGMIGFFANTLVLRAQATPERTFQEVLASVRATTLAAYQHQNLPFERLVEVLSPQRSLNTTPLFQVLFVLQNAPTNVRQPKDLKIAAFTGEEIAAGELRVRFDLELHAWESDGAIQFYWIYNRDLFDRWRMEQMARHYTRLLETVVANRRQTLGELDILSGDEKRMLLEEFNATAYPVPNATLPALLEQQAAETPETPAVVSGKESISYANLNSQANRLARYLISSGVGPDSVVGIAMERSIGMIVAFLGVLKAGAAYLPLDPDYPSARLAYMIEDAEPVRVLATESVSLSLPRGAPLVFLHDSGVLEELEQYSTANVRDNERIQPLVPEHPAYVIYTSGSTGTPKGVMMPGRALVNLLAWHAANITSRPGARVAQFTALSFDVSAQEILSTLTSGKTLCVPPNDIRRNPAEFAAWLELHAVNELYAPNLVIDAICEAGNDREDKMPSLIELVQAGEALTLNEHVRAFCSAGKTRWVHNHYGPTETHVITSHRLPQDTAEWPISAPIGRPIWNTRIYLLDRSLRPVPAGVMGELYAGGAGVARGYLKRPDMTAERFLPDPYGLPGSRMYRTGDLAWWRANGVLEFVGRADHQVKIRGFRIELGEIEVAIAAEPEVAQVAVVVREDNPRGKQIVGYVVPADGRVVDTAVLRRRVGERVPDYMVPAALVILPALPLTANGKLDRRALPAPEKANEGYRAPRNPQEEMLCELFAEVLSLPSVGIDDNFFALGGHSLMAMRLVSRIRATLGVEISIRILFESPSVAELGLQLKNSEKARLPLERRVRPTHAPVSYAQQRLWFLNQLRGTTVEYNLPDALRLRGDLDLAALEQALSTIVERHESLRTHFDVVNDKPVQIVVPARPLDLMVEDISELADMPKQERLQAAMRLVAREPFDLARGPVFRFRLLKLANNEHVLLRAFHHIVWDAWSWNVFDREFVLLYQAFREHREMPLEPLPVQYVDFTLWQLEWLNDGVLQRQLDYWKKQLERIPEQLELPKDRPRSALQSFSGEMCRMMLSPAQAAGLKHLAQRSSATLYMTLLSVFAVLLQRYSGQDDIVVGSPIANRQESHLEQMIGFFVNTLPMRVRVQPRNSFRELLDSVRGTTLEAYLNQDLPFEKLVEELSPQRILNTTPIFQVLFVLQNAPSSVQEIKGLEIEPVPGYELTVRFELELHIWERETGIEFYWMYNRDLFDAWRIEQMAGHYKNLLDEIIAAPQKPIWQLEMMGAQGRQLLQSWNRTERRYATQGWLHELFELHVEEHPERTAVIFEGRKVSYGELNRGANRIARKLRAMGVGPEVLVGIYMERSVELVMGLMGIMKAGGAYVPMDPEYPAERLEWMRQEAGIKVVLTQDTWRELGQAEWAKGTEVVVVEANAEMEAEEEANLESVVEGNNLAYVIYTSGSTGKPKGAMNTHAAIRNRLLWMDEAYGAGAGDRILQKTPFTFDVSVWEFFWPLITGRCLVVARPGGHRDGEYLVKLIEQELISTLHFVPSMLGAFLQVAEPGRCPSMRQVICSGEALPVEMADEFLRRHGAALHNLYGPTEAAVDVTYWECRKGYKGATIPIGKPIANLQMHVLNEELQSVPVGVAGELYIGGEGVGRGYMKRPDWTAERFVPNSISQIPGERLYRTGDKGRYLVDGEIEFLGRLDYQVKIRGFRIELGEIEAVMGQHPGVAAAAVVAQGEPEKRLVGFFVAKAEATVDGSGLQEFMKGKLPEYMLPGQFVELKEMPLTSSGKIDRRALPTPDKVVATESYVAPRTAVEELLAEIWAEVLSVQRVGINDNFFDLGGHSILAVSLLVRIRDATKCNLALQKLFESPTIGQLAPLVVEHSPRPDQAERIASLVLKVRRMTPEERKKNLRALKEQKVQANAVVTPDPSTGTGG